MPENQDIMAPEDFIACVRDSRRTLHGQLKLLEEVIARCPKPAIAEVILAKRKMQEARMWLGQSMAAFPEVTNFQQTDI